jgi:hypothetical protein
MSIYNLRMSLEPQLLQVPGVTGVGNLDDRIRLYVEGTPDIFPTHINNVKLEVVKTGKLHPLELMNVPWFLPKKAMSLERTGRFRPLKGGCSIGHPLITAGTLGCAIKLGGVKYGLSNNHVLAAASSAQNPRASIGDPIYQPGCYSADTRVMTEDGLKSFYSISKNDKVMTLNLKTSEIEYQNPTKIHEYDYNGKMVHFYGQMYDLLVTPNHQLVIQKVQPHRHGKEDRKIAIAEELLEGVKTVYNQAKELHRLLGNHYAEIGRRLGINPRTIRGWLYFNKTPSISYLSCQFIKTGTWNCSDEVTFKIDDLEFEMEDWLRFLGWYISEGSLGGVRKENSGDYIISIRQKNKENLKLIADAIHRLGFKPNIRWEHGSVTFNSKKLHNYLKRFGKANTKYIPKDLKALPPNKLKILLDSLISGDGSIVGTREDEYKDSYLGKPRKYFTISKRLAEDVIEIGIKCGYGMSIHKRPRLKENWNDYYVVGFSCRNLTPKITNKPKEIPYSGKVYDITIPNHTLMVERGGKLIWSGNCYDGGTEADTIGTLYWYKPFDEKGVNVIDAALFKPASQDLLSEEILDIGLINGIGVATEGSNVQKSGRTTGVTVSDVLDVNATVKVDYGIFGLTLSGQIITNYMADGGDSGSALLDMDRNLVGLLFAGSSYVTVHNHIAPIIQAIGGAVPGPPGVPTAPARTPYPFILPPIVGSLIGGLVR